MKLDHSLPTEGASGFRTVRRDLVLLGAQSQAPDSQAAPLLVGEESMLFAKLGSPRKDGQIP